MKKLKVAIILFFLCIMCASNCFATEVYSDIAGTPYEGAIEALTELGIINGYEDGTFKPLNSVNRAEYTKLLVVATGLEDAADLCKGATKFSDVGAEHWACGYINIADEYGYISGYSDGTFRPNNAITYEEAIMYTVRALGYKYTLEEAYITKAEELNLIDTLVFSSYSDELTRGNACILLWNMLRTDMWDVKNDNGKIKIPVPSLNYTYGSWTTYTGETQIAKLKNFNEDIMTITNNEQKNVGKYDITISLKYPDEYEWKIYDEDTDEYTYTTETQILKWQILKKVYVAPFIRYSNKFEYNGTEIKIKLVDFDSEIMTVSGDTATEIGKYKATVSLIDKENNQWSTYIDGIHTYTSDDLEIEWEIVKGKLEVPYLFVDHLFPYNGEEQDLRTQLCGYDEKIMNISGEYIATNAGTYKVTYSLKDTEHYEWKFYYKNKITYSIEDQERNWIIDKKQIKLPVASMCYYTGEEQEAKFTNYGENMISITNNKATDVGTYKAIVSLIDKSNYQWKIYDEATETYSYTTEDQEIEWKIEKQSISIPTVSKDCNYTGKERKAILKNFDEDIMSISGDKATEIGEYKAIISLKDKNNYQWEKGGTEDITLTWKITQGILGIPTADKNIYTGIEQEANIRGFDEELMNISGNIGTNAGNYKAIISIKDKTKYQWKNGTTEDVILNWQIKKVPCDIEIVNRNLILGEELKVLITPNITDGTIIIWYEEKNNGGVYNKNQLPTETGLYKVKIQVLDDKNLLETIKEEYIIIEEAKSNNNTNSTTITTTTSSSRGGSSSSSTRTYKATITQTTGGTITVDKTEVEKGDKQVFTIVANEGYKIVDVKVDGKSVGAVNTYTIEKVTKKHKITAVFEKLTEEELKELEESKETTWVNTFEDITSGDWYYEAVKFVNEAGLFKGLSDTEFGANVTMNRAMIVTVLHRLAGEPEVQNSNVKFNDVSNEEYYTNAVIWAVENGIVNGVGNNEFAPQDNVTREQLIVMLYRYAKLTGNLSEEQANLSAYDDVDLISDYAKEAFSWAIQEGIITGRTTTTLAPQDIATRAEVATMIMRFSNMINEA